MTSPRTKKMLLLAAATMASPAACTSNEGKVSGFYGDIAYDGGYEETGSFNNPDGHAVPDVHVADAADAGDATDAEIADADADADQ